MILSSSSCCDERLSASVASPEVSLVEVSSCQPSIPGGERWGRWHQRSPPSPLPRRLSPALHVPGTLRIGEFLSCGCRPSTSSISRLALSVFHKWRTSLSESASGTALHTLGTSCVCQAVQAFSPHHSAFWCRFPSSIFARPLFWDQLRTSVFASHLSSASSNQPHSWEQICR